MPGRAWLPVQLEALYALLDDDGSGTLTVHEMIDLFVRHPTATPPYRTLSAFRCLCLPPLSPFA